MKKKKFVKTVMSFVFAAFLVAMALPAFAAEGYAVKFVEYRSEEFGFSFSYPDFFKPEYNVGIEKTDLVCFDWNEEKYELTVSVSERAEGPTVHDLLEHSINMDSSAGLEIIEDSIKSDDWYFSYRCDPDSGGYLRHIKLILNDEAVALYNFRYLEEEEDTVGKYFELMEESLKFDSQNGTATLTFNK